MRVITVTQPVIKSMTLVQGLMFIKVLSESRLGKRCQPFAFEADSTVYSYLIFVGFVALAKLSADL